MPWFIWFCFLTAPPIIGVAVTLSWPASTVSPDLATVLGVGAAWICAALLIMKQLRDFRPKQWARLWVLACVLLPVTGLFVHSLGSDPAVAAFFDRHNKAVEREGPGASAPSAPSRHALTWAEVGELLAHVLPRGLRFSLQLLLCLPPAWWLAAFAIAVWRGK